VDWFSSIEVSSLDLIEAYVANGFGIGLSVLAPKAKLSLEIRALPLPGFAPVVVGALWRGRPSALLQAFLAEMQVHAKRLV
jgi:DNA-binding transcriptional LysR family regulator